jgi:hypothetical protein
MWENNLILYNKFHIITTNKIMMNYVHFSQDSKLYIIYWRMLYFGCLSCLCVSTCTCAYKNLTEMLPNEIQGAAEKPCGFEIK